MELRRDLVVTTTTTTPGSTLTTTTSEGIRTTVSMSHLNRNRIRTGVVTHERPRSPQYFYELNGGNARQARVEAVQDYQDQDYLIPLSKAAHDRIASMYLPPVASRETGMCRGFGVPVAECPTRATRPICFCLQFTYLRQHAAVFLPLYRLRMYDIP
jgi:hypothetical protein